GVLGTVSAQDYIPAVVPVLYWDTTTTFVTEYDYTTERLALEFTINDPSIINNYYVLEVTQTQYYYVDYIYDPNSRNITYDTVYYDNPIHYKTQFSTTDQILLA